MRSFLMALATALPVACGLVPGGAAPVPETAPEAALTKPATTTAEAPVAPQMNWHSTGKGLWIYHNVWGDCAFLEHGHGRNSAWGLWRLPLGKVVASAPEADVEEGGYTVRFTCTDGSACIESGFLYKTPDRIDTHTIPFETEERAEAYLSLAASFDTACKALK